MHFIHLSLSPFLLSLHTHPTNQVVKAKDGAGSATLSMAYAGYLFTSAMLKALGGQSGVVQCAFVENSLTKVRGRGLLCWLWVVGGLGFRWVGQAGKSHHPST